MSDTIMDKMKYLSKKWKEALSPGSNVDPNRLAEETLKVIEREPLIQDVCQAFLFSLSIMRAKDPNFDKSTYKKL